MSKGSKKSKKSKGSKSKRSKTGDDDDDDGKGKGSKKKKSKYGSSEDTTGRFEEPERKDPSEGEKDPEDDVEEIMEGARAIVPEKKPNNDFAVGTTDKPNFEAIEESDYSFVLNIESDKAEKDDSISATIENPHSTTRDSNDSFVQEIDDTGATDDSTDMQATANPTEDNTEESTDGFVVETVSKFVGDIRTVQILHPEDENKCMKYDFVLDEMALYMAECSTSKTRKDDYWEILQMYGEEELFQLRHKSTRLCIPANSEKPGHPFNCIQYFGMGEAIADSFRGLVNCLSPHAAVFEVDDSSNSLYMSNSGCQDESFVDPVPVFMTYNKKGLTGRSDTVVWGGRILLDLQEGVEDYNFNSKWKFVYV